MMSLCGLRAGDSVFGGGASEEGGAQADGGGAKVHPFLPPLAQPCV